MTLVGGASFNGGKSIEGIHGLGWDEQELWKRSEGEGDELRALKGENPSFPQILPFHNTNIELSMGRMQRENTELKRAQGQAGRPRNVASRPHSDSKNSGIFPKISF
jgi:hypothetical protein